MGDSTAQADLGSIDWEAAFPAQGSLCWQRGGAGRPLASLPPTRPGAADSERRLPRPRPRGRRDAGADPRPGGDPYLLAPGCVRRLLGSARNSSGGQIRRQKPLLRAQLKSPRPPLIIWLPSLVSTFPCLQKLAPKFKHVCVGARDAHRVPVWGPRGPPHSPRTSVCQRRWLDLPQDANQPGRRGRGRRPPPAPARGVRGSAARGAVRGRRGRGTHGVVGRRPACVSAGARLREPPPPPPVCDGFRTPKPEPPRFKSWKPLE